MLSFVFSTRRGSRRPSCVESSVARCGGPFLRRWASDHHAAPRTELSTRVTERLSACVAGGLGETHSQLDHVAVGIHNRRAGDASNPNALSGVGVPPFAATTSSAVSREWTSKTGLIAQPSLGCGGVRISTVSAIACGTG